MCGQPPIILIFTNYPAKMHKPWRGLGFLVGDSCFGLGSRYKLARPRSYSRQPLARSGVRLESVACLTVVEVHGGMLTQEQAEHWSDLPGMSLVCLLRCKSAARVKPGVKTVIGYVVCRLAT